MFFFFFSGKFIIFDEFDRMKVVLIGSLDDSRIKVPGSLYSSSHSSISSGSFSIGKTKVFPIEKFSICSKI